jgi:hypothetical protein
MSQRCKYAACLKPTPCTLCTRCSVAAQAPLGSIRAAAALVAQRRRWCGLLARWRRTERCENDRAAFAAAASCDCACCSEAMPEVAGAVLRLLTGCVWLTS